MCLFTTHFFPKISFKKIKVYKVVLEYNGGLITPFQCSKPFKRAKGIFFFPKRCGHRLFIEKGMLHAFIDKASAISQKSAINSTSYSQAKIINAYIPPFTRYYIGEYGDICAKRMRYEIFN